MKKISAFIALVLAMTMLLAGCGKTTTSSEMETGKADVAIKGGITATESNGEEGSNDTADGTNNATGNGAGNTATQSAGKNNTTVAKKEYTIKAKGSKYADGIMLPELSKKQAKITYMTNTTWDYIKQESSEASPTAIYHAMMIWKETYGVDVEIEMVDWGSFTSHLMTSVVAGEGPDVMRWVGGRPKWISNRLVTSLDDKMDLSDPDYAMDKMKLSYSMNGHIYALQSHGMKMPDTVIAYNKTKFEKAGETDPMTLYKSGKWTFSQFIKTAKNMTDAANNEYGVTGTGNFYPAAFNLMHLNDNGKVTLNITNSNFVKCMQSVWKLYRVENAARRTDDARSTFPLGQDAMYPTNMKEYCRMMDTAKANGTTDKFGVVPYPSYDMIGQTNPFGSDVSYLEAFSVSAAPRNLEGALEFARLVTKVGSNISKELGDWGWGKSYMSDEEKSVFSKVKYTMWDKEDCTSAIDGTNDVINDYLKYPIYLLENTDKDLSTILASAKGALEGVIKEYEIDAGLRK